MQDLINKVHCLEFSEMCARLPDKSLFCLTPWLSFHVATLTQPYQIAQNICFFCRGKFSERLDMMNRKTSSAVLTAISTLALLLGNDNYASALPLSPSISLLTSDPMRGIIPAFICRFVSRTAFITAKFSSTSLTTNLPRFLFKWYATHLAFTMYRFNPFYIITPCGLSNFKRISRAHTLPDCITLLEGVTHRTHITYTTIIFPVAISTAKFCRFLTVWFYIKCVSTLYACYFNHEITPNCLLNYKTIRLERQCVGSGTTALACYRTGRNFICSDFTQEYVDIARERLQRADPYMPTKVSDTEVQLSLFSQLAE
jgi:hypothetical protein